MPPLAGSIFDPNCGVMVFIFASEESSPRYQHHDPAGGVNFESEESMFDPKGGVNLQLKEGTFDPTSGVKCILNASEESSLGLQPILVASLEAT